MIFNILYIYERGLKAYYLDDNIMLQIKIKMRVVFKK